LPVERLTFDELDLVASCGFDAAKLSAGWRNSLVAPIHAHRFPLLGRIAPGWLPWDLRYDWSRKTDASGWTTPPKQNIEPHERAEREAKVEAEYRGALSGLVPQGRPLATLHRIAELARGERIPVSFVWMPEAASFQRLYPPGLIDRVTTATAGLPNLIIARDWLDDGDLYDGHHPFAAGASKFTERLMRGGPPAP